MKIAVCVKAVPDAATGRRLDPATGRLDRSGELALSEFDTHAVEEALRLRDAAGEGEVGRPSRSARRARSTPCARALAMGADRSVLVADDAFAGADLLVDRPCARGRARARGARPRPLRPAVGGRRRRMPLGRGRGAAAAAGRSRRSPSSRSTRARSPGGARPSSATSASVRRCRRVVAVSDAINEPRYPSLKGIMGAKSKPQETLSAADVGGAGRVADDGARPSRRRRRAARRRRVEGGAEAAAAIVDFLAEKRLL